ncbi:hypothetical protein VP01_6558g1, partial [Puccinia sorghi]
VIMCFLVWLYLVCGLSQEKCRIARDHILAIIDTFTHPKDDLEIIMAKDIRTILKNLNMNPNFTSYVCCPKCYTLYPLKTQQAQCVYRTTSRAPACGQDLIKPQNLPQHGILPWVQPQTVYQPHTQYKSVYVTQDFEEWISWFLLLPHIEKSIEDWTERLPQINLLIISSFGVLALTCLDMPPHLRHQTHHLFLAGIIPGPKEPDMITMSNILKPLIDKLLVLNERVRMLTFKFPNGRKQEINELCPGKLRHGRATISQSLKWREATTINARDKIFKQYGVRWSELNQLPYWNPVKNVVLGVMHNCLIQTVPSMTTQTQMTSKMKTQH